MKNIFKTLLIVLFISALGIQKSSAQGNLQFNQVIFYDITYGSTQAFNVPAGKVWKVESVGASVTSCIVYLQNAAAQNVAILYYVSASNVSPAYPIWFPSGHSGFFAYNTNSCTGAHAFVSIIEFNVVP